MWYRGWKHCCIDGMEDEVGMYQSECIKVNVSKLYRYQRRGNGMEEMWWKNKEE
jgi:hypothetical protein